MTLTLGSIFISTALDAVDVLTIRHAYDSEPEGSTLTSIQADSTDDEILLYTSIQSAKASQFSAAPPRFWVVFLPDGRGRARFWAVVENRGELSNDGIVRTFDLVIAPYLGEFRTRLVVTWPSARAWRMLGKTAAAKCEVLEIADAKPIFFPGFDKLVLDYAQLQAVMRERRYESWLTALSSVTGVYLITDTRDGRHYVGKADGSERISQRWKAYATNGHGGNVELRKLEPSTFRFSLLRVFGPATPNDEIDAAESHFKDALDSRRHGLNRN
jgi:hypothetical protein